VYVHISVARVSKPVGLSMRVAGSSFIAAKKTKRVPVSTFGAARGSTTAEKVCRRLFPRVDDISIRFVGTRDMAALIGPTAFAIKRIE
jgi:hypothetical protein